MLASSSKIEIRPVSQLKPYRNNARAHSKKQIRQIADSISRFGFNNPVLVDDAGQIIAGHFSVHGMPDGCCVVRSACARSYALYDSRTLRRTLKGIEVLFRPPAIRGSGQNVSSI